MDTQEWHPFLDTVANFLLRSDSPHSFDLLQAREIVGSSWLQAAKGSRALLPSLVLQSAKTAANKIVVPAVTVEIDDRASHAGDLQQGKIRIHPMGSLFLITQPFHLLVEDETSDGGFLLWVARALGRDQIIQAYRAGALTFRHAGGKGQFSKSAKALSFGVWPRDTLFEP